MSISWLFGFLGILIATYGLYESDPALILCGVAVLISTRFMRSE